MSRISPASPPYPQSIQTVFDKLVPPGMEPILLFRILARDERLFARSMGAGLLDRGHLSLREREIIILRVCANNRSQYEWGVHVVAFAARAGLSDVQVTATVEASPDAACWTARDRLLLRVCDELLDGTLVSDALWAELAAEYTPEALVEILLLAGFYRTISVLTNTLQMPLESFAARFPSQVAPDAG